MDGWICFVLLCVLYEYKMDVQDFAIVEEVGYAQTLWAKSRLPGLTD